MFKGGIWLFAGSSISSVLNFLFWVIASSFVSVDIIGYAASIISLLSIFITISTLGIPAGLQRYVGIAKGEDDSEKITSYFLTGLSTLIVVNVPIILFFIIVPSLGFGSIIQQETILVALLLLLGFWIPLFNSLFMALIRADIMTLAQILASFAKTVLCFVLLSFGLGFMGLFVSISAFYVVHGIVLFTGAYKNVNKSGTGVLLDKTRLKSLLEAGTASWIPRVLATIGESSGVLIIFGLVGGAETGYYFLAFAISSIFYTLPGSILGLMFPYLSSIKRGRSQAALDAIRLSLAITAPLASVLIIYSYLPFLFLGSEFIKAGPMLGLLLIGAILSTIVSGYFSHAYAAGKYRHVAMIGLVMNISRLIMYSPLVISLSGIGAAIAFTLGQVFALIAVIGSANRTGFNFEWGRYLKAITILLLPAVFLIILNIHWLIGIPLFLLLSIVAYGRLGVITKDDLREVSLAFFSEDSVRRIYAYVGPLFRFIFD